MRRENPVLLLVIGYGNHLLELAIRAVIIMFVAAVIYKRFDVFAAIGYVESLAWAAGYGLVKGLWTRDDTQDRS